MKLISNNYFKLELQPLVKDEREEFEIFEQIGLTLQNPQDKDICFILALHTIQTELKERIETALEDRAQKDLIEIEEKFKEE